MTQSNLIKQKCGMHKYREKIQYINNTHTVEKDTQKKLLWVKMMFEEVSFKTSFEGRERQAVMEIKRERIPEGLSTILLLFGGGDTKSSIITGEFVSPFTTQYRLMNITHQQKQLKNTHTKKPLQLFNPKQSEKEENASSYCQR